MPRKYATDADRIRQNVTESEDGCWEWQLSRDGNGYSRLRVEKKLHYGHRFAYELFVGPIPEGLHLDHLCRNRACVNPEHLEPVTCAVNIGRGIGVAAQNAAKGACSQGHPFDEANTYRHDGRRGCRVCRRAAVRAHAQRRAFRAASIEVAA